MTTSVAGVYVVTYDATDTSGNAATQATRTVTVEEEILPSEFRLDSVDPVTGPKAGGTPVTLTGEFLEVGQSAFTSVAAVSSIYKVYFSKYVTAEDLGNDRASCGRVQGRSRTIPRGFADLPVRR